MPTFTKITRGLFSFYADGDVAVRERLEGETEDEMPLARAVRPKKITFAVFTTPRLHLRLEPAGLLVGTVRPTARRLNNQISLYDCVCVGSGFCNYRAERFTAKTVLGNPEGRWVFVRPAVIEW